MPQSPFRVVRVFRGPGPADSLNLQDSWFPCSDFPIAQASKQFDCIVIGGGHNGLVAAAYLAQGGKRVCVLERRHVLGAAR